MKASLIMLAGRPVRGGEGFFGKLLLVPVDQVGRNEAGLALRGFSVSGLLREGNLRSRSLGGGGLPRPESKATVFAMSRAPLTGLPALASSASSER